MLSLIFAFLWISNLSFAATVHKKIFILSDSIETVGGAKFPYKTFNETNWFDKTNSRIELNVFDSLSLWVVNKDTIAHHFEIKDISDSELLVPINDSIRVGIMFDMPGSYIYYDPLNYPTQAFLGLAGMLVVKDHNHSSFYWNIKEHDSLWNVDLVNNYNVDWNQYAPKYFTINGNSNPNINMDSDARVVGNVEDTLIVYITNSGQSIHAMHLHGYHAEILYSSKESQHVGRSKDTFPIYPMETLVIQIIPDKPGEYPVHDHNLVAVTGNNIYPNGMVTTMLINP